MVLQQGMILGGRYEVLEKVGAGGMAIVYRARDRKLERYIALKVLREEFCADDDFVMRFKTEAQSAASLSHPNIVNVFDVGQDGNVYYIVMELLNGQTLKELITQRAPIDSVSTAGIASQIASALQHAHKSGIIHRDIKPQNIMVTSDGTVKVMDFGIARAATSKTFSVAGSVIGSVHYFSPEQARGGYVDEKSDIYSLGIIMYEMTTGRVPFDGETPVAVAMRHTNESLPLMHSYNKDVSKSIELITLKATQKKPESRYTNIDEMYVDIRRAMVDDSGSFVSQEDTAASPTNVLDGGLVKTIRNGYYGDDDSRRLPGLDDRTAYTDSGDVLDEHDEHTGDDEKGGWKIVLGAVVSALVIIGVLIYFGLQYLDSQKPPAVPEVVLIKVPLLVGMDYDDADELMSERGLMLNKSETTHSEDYEVNQIIWQDYKEESELLEGEVVNVHVSLGPELIPIPNVVNMEESEAILEFENMPIKRIDPVYENSDDVAYGVVIRQEPGGGEQVRKNITVTLYISKGREIKKVIVPDVRNKPEAEANEMLEEVGLTVGQPTRIFSDVVQKGRVIAQNVKAHSEVDQGKIVSLVISEGKEQREEPPEPQKPQQITKSFPVSDIYLPEGAETVLVEIYMIAEAAEPVVKYSQEHDVSDFPFNIGIQGSGTAEVSLYINGKMCWTEPVSFNEGE